MSWGITLTEVSLHCTTDTNIYVTLVLFRLASKASSSSSETSSSSSSSSRSSSSSSNSCCSSSADMPNLLEDVPLVCGPLELEGPGSRFAAACACSAHHRWYVLETQTHHRCENSLFTMGGGRRVMVGGCAAICYCPLQVKCRGFLRLSTNHDLFLFTLRRKDTVLHQEAIRL